MAEGQGDGNISIIRILAEGRSDGNDSFSQWAFRKGHFFCCQNEWKIPSMNHNWKSNNSREDTNNKMLLHVIINTLLGTTWRGDMESVQRKESSAFLIQHIK